MKSYVLKPASAYLLNFVVIQRGVFLFSYFYYSQALALSANQRDMKEFYLRRGWRVYRFNRNLGGMIWDEGVGAKMMTMNEILGAQGLTRPLEPIVDSSLQGAKVLRKWKAKTKKYLLSPKSLKRDRRGLNKGTRQGHQAKYRLMPRCEV